MTLGERLIWAAAYAAAHRQMLADKSAYGTAEYVAGAIEEAWAAVVNAREVRASVSGGWGENDEVTVMLDEMLAP